MAEYHVGCNPETNIIYAGTVNKKGDKWVNQSVVTEEVLGAVRNHFLWIAGKEETNEVGYRWTLDDGRAVTLKLIIEDNPPEVKEKKDVE